MTSFIRGKRIAPEILDIATVRKGEVWRWKLFCAVSPDEIEDGKECGEHKHMPNGCVRAWFDDDCEIFIYMLNKLEKKKSSKLFSSISLLFTQNFKFIHSLIEQIAASSAYVDGIWENSHLRISFIRLRDEHSCFFPLPMVPCQQNLSLKTTEWICCKIRQHHSDITEDERRNSTHSMKIKQFLCFSLLFIPFFRTRSLIFCFIAAVFVYSLHSFLFFSWKLSSFFFSQDLLKDAKERAREECRGSAKSDFVALYDTFFSSRKAEEGKFT